MKQLCIICQVPTPEQYGITKQDFFAQIDKMAADAVASGSPGNTAREVTEADCAALYRKLYE